MALSSYGCLNQISCCHSKDLQPSCFIGRIKLILLHGTYKTNTMSLLLKIFPLEPNFNGQWRRAKPPYEIASINANNSWFKAKKRAQRGNPQRPDDPICRSHQTTIYCNLAVNSNCVEHHKENLNAQTEPARKKKKKNWQVPSTSGQDLKCAAGWFQDGPYAARAICFYESGTQNETLQRSFGHWAE